MTRSAGRYTELNNAPKNLFEAVSLDAPFTNLPRSIWVGGLGDLSVTDISGVTTVFAAVPAGTEMPIRPAVVNSVGTSATLIVALF